MALDNAVSQAESTMVAEGCGLLVCSMATADILCVCGCVEGCVVEDYTTNMGVYVHVASHPVCVLLVLRSFSLLSSLSSPSLRGSTHKQNKHNKFITARCTDVKTPL